MKGKSPTLIETEMYIWTLSYFTSYWISNLKGSIYPFLCILVFFKSLFLARLDTTYISGYVILRRLKFEVFKTEKTLLKTLNKGKYIKLKMKNLKPLKELLSSYYTHFLGEKKNNPIDTSHYCLTKFCWKTF